MSAIIVTHTNGEDRWDGPEVEFHLDGDDIVQITNRMPVVVTQAMVDDMHPIARPKYQGQIGEEVLSDPVVMAVYANGYWRSIKLERDQAEL